jgi:hypothetical protein
MRSKVLKQNNLMPARAQLRSSLEERASRSMGNKRLTDPG